jgi:predicted lipoprotein with Yx(FWY)xxD motif
MALDKETSDTIKELVAPIVGSALSVALVGAAMAIISKLVVTNYQESDLTGEKGMHPTQNDTSISKTETSAKDNEASLAKDGLKAKDGDLSAAQTDAKALTTDAKALDSGASAVQPKAGALDVKTKGLVMS